MDKVAVIGCGGSGKSRVARALAGVLDAPLTHLDAIYFDKHWNRLPIEEFEAAQRDLVAAPRWVIDGNYHATLPIRLHAADTVVFLDKRAVACLWGVLSRHVRHGYGQNTSSGVFNRITWHVLSYIIGYRASMRPRVLAAIDQHATHAHVIVLTSRRQTRAFLRDAASGARSST